MYNSIKPGELWLDTKGKQIQAHGFSLFYKDGLYYWYGENKEHTKPGGKVWHWGIRCYTSKDFYNWEDKGLIIPPEPDDLYSPLHPTYSMDRPHIIYCEKTKKYVAWLKIMASETSQFYSILQADDFFGPYTYVNKIYKALDMDGGDFALHVDDTTKKAYIFFERPHFELVTATLTDDYTAVNGEFSQHYQNYLPPLTREAPTYFERNGKKYLFTSGTTGYFPNPSMTAMFDDYHGEYIDLGSPHVDDTTDSSLNSQIACVIKIPNKDLYVACADRWMPDLDLGLVPRVLAGMKMRYADYKIDTSPRTAGPLPGKEIERNEDTGNARYIFLPIKWDGDKPIIKWHNEWRLEDYK